MKKLKEIIDHGFIANTVTLCIGIAFYMLLSHFDAVKAGISSVGSILSPVIIGVIVAYLLDPIAGFAEKKLLRGVKKEGTRRTIASVIAIVVVILAVVLFFSVLIPSLVSSVSGLIVNADSYRDTLEVLAARVNDMGLGASIDLTALTSIIERGAEALLDYITGNASSILTKSVSIGSAIFNAAIGFIIGVYFLIGKKSALSALNELRSAAMSADTLKKHNKFWRRCHKIMLQFVGCNLIDSLIIGVLSAIIMLIIGMPYVGLMALIIGVTNLVPTFGPIIGGVIGAFLMLLNRPIYALYIIVIMVAVQIFDGYVLKPKLFAGSLGLPSVLTLISIIIGGDLFGIMGMLLAIPVAAILLFVYKEAFLPWLASRKNRA